MLLKINHHTALHGHPTPSEDDWEDPWDYQFVVFLGYGEKRIVDVIVHDYFGLTSSKKPFDKLYINRVESFITSHKSVEARWINKSSKFNTLEELVAYYKSSTESYSNKSYWVKGVLEIKAVDVVFPTIIRYEDLDKIKLYAAIRGWSGPGDMSGPLWWLLAYDTMDITDLFRQGLQEGQVTSPEGAGGEGETSIPSTSVPSYASSGGYDEGFSNALLRYRLHFHANVTGYTGGESINDWVVSNAEYHMRIKDFSNGEFYVNATTVGLEVKGSDPDMEDLAYSVYRDLNTSGQTSILEFSRGLQYLVYFMDSYLSKLNIYDVDYNGVFTWYKGVPAVKYTITGNGVTTIRGESYNYEVNVTSYYDTFIGLPLYVNGTVHLFDQKEDSWIDFHLTLSLELKDGLNYFPRQEEIPSTTCTLTNGDQAYMGLEASNARIIDARIDDDSDLLLVVSGTGSGSLIIVVNGDSGVEEILVDGEPVDYLQLVSIPDEKTIIVVPLTFSQHQIKISFTQRVDRLGSVGQPGEEIGQTSPQTSVAVQPGSGSGGSPSTEEPVETVVPTNMLGDLWLIIVIVVIVVAVIGGLVFVFTRGRRRRQPYYLPPPPPPPY